MHEGERPRLEGGQPAQRRGRVGVRRVPWNMSSAARAGPIRSAPCTSAGPSPICVSRSPQNRVRVVSSKTTCASHPWGTWGVGACGSEWPPMSSGRSSSATTGGRSARSLSDTMQPSALNNLGWRRRRQPQVHGAALVGLDVAEADPPQALDVEDLARPPGDQREHLARTGVEQERLVGVDQVLVEGEAAGGDLRDARRQAVHAVGDLMDVGLHGRACDARPACRIGGPSPN